MDEIKFTVGEVQYKVRQPNAQEVVHADMVYNKAFNKALLEDFPLQSQVSDILKKRGMWDDDKQTKLEQYYQDIAEKEFILHKGGIPKKKARQVAIDLKKLRADLQRLFSPISDFNQHTCEGYGQNAKFDYLVSACTVYDDGRPYFSSVDDYKTKANDPVAIIGSSKFAELHYLIGANDLTSDLPENQFLKEYGFADEKGRLIDEKGRFVTPEGRLIDENGNLIDEDGNFVDAYGHKLDKEGNFAVERQPFLDDEADSEQDSANT